MPAWIFVFLGGGLGSVCRWSVAKYFSHEDGSFPVATFAANLIACLILGLLMGYHLKSPMSNQHKLLLMVGFCGGFSTFSTFSADIFTLLKTGNYITAFSYVGVSIILGLVAVFCGLKIME